MTRMLRYALIVSGAALALGAASTATANVAPERGTWIPIFVIHIQDEDDDPVDKAIGELHSSLKDFIGDVSAMHNMTDAQKIAYIKDKFKERVKQKTAEQAYAFAKDQMKAYAESAVKAAAYDRIRARVTHEILINGALSPKAWDLLKGQSDQAFEQIFGSLKVIGSGTEIVGKVLYEKFDKIVSNQYSWKEGALDVLGGVYDALGESYIPFYGPFKKVVEVELALIEALKAYCKDETINLWIGRVYEFNTLEAGFRMRLANTLRTYSSKDQLREVWKRRFYEASTSGFYTPQSEEKIKEFEAEAWMQVLGVWQEVQKDKELAQKQAKELETQALMARLEAERKQKAMKEALKAGMDQGQQALAKIDQFLRVEYAKAVKARAAQLKEKAEQDKGKTDSGAMQGETFDGASKLISFVQQFGAQLKSSWQQLKDLAPEVRSQAANQFSALQNEIGNKNGEAYSRAYKKINEQKSASLAQYQNQQISYESYTTNIQRLDKLVKDAAAQLNAQQAIIQAEVLAACSEVTAEVSVVADPIVDREVDRIIENVNLSYETAVKELDRIRDKAAQLVELPYPFTPGVNRAASPQSRIDTYDEFVEFVAAHRKFIDTLADLEAQEAKVVEKYGNELFLQRELYKKIVPNALIYETMWTANEMPGQPGLDSAGYWFVEVRPEVTAKSVTVLSLGRDLTGRLKVGRDTLAVYEQTLENLERRADLARPIIPFNAAAARLYGPNAVTKVSTNSWITLYVDGKWDYSEWKFLPNLDTHKEEAKRLIDSLGGASVGFDQAKKSNYYNIGGQRFDFPEPSNFVNKTGLVDGKLATMLNPEIIKRVEAFFLDPLRQRWQEISADIPKLVELGSKIKRQGSYERSDPLMALGRVMSESMLPEKIKIFEDAFKDLIAKNTKAIDDFDKMQREAQQQSDAEQKRQQQEQKQRVEQQTPIVRSIYDTFKRAYESRNDSAVAACLHKDWTAPDGTRISQMQETLRRSFRFFDEVKYEISDLKIDYSNYIFDGQTREDVYKVTYSLTIRGRNYSRNIRHEEKSQVVELVVIKDGKALIKQTLEGRTWPGDGRSQ